MFRDQSMSLIFCSEPRDSVQFTGRFHLLRLCPQGVVLRRLGHFPVGRPTQGGRSMRKMTCKMGTLMSSRCCSISDAKLYRLSFTVTRHPRNNQNGGLPLHEWYDQKWPICACLVIMSAFRLKCNSQFLKISLSSADSYLARLKYRPPASFRPAEEG